MINIRTLKKVQENGGLTLKAGKTITYKSGWQVATEGIATTDINEAMKAIRNYNGDCGVWLENGVFFVDKSQRVSTKKEAIKLGQKYHQISILKWSDMSLLYL